MNYKLILFGLVVLVLLSGCIDYEPEAIEIEEVEKIETTETSSESINLEGISDDGKIEDPNALALLHMRNLLEKDNYTINTKSTIADEASAYSLFGQTNEDRKSTSQKVDLVREIVYTSETEAGSLVEHFYDGDRIYEKNRIGGENIITYEDNSISDEEKAHFSGTLQFLISNQEKLEFKGEMKENRDIYIFKYNETETTGDQIEIEELLMKINREGIILKTVYYEEQYVEQDGEIFNREANIVETEIDNIGDTNFEEPEWVGKVGDQPIF